MGEKTLYCSVKLACKITPQSKWLENVCQNQGKEDTDCRSFIFQIFAHIHGENGCYLALKNLTTNPLLEMAKSEAVHGLYERPWASFSIAE